MLNRLMDIQQFRIAKTCDIFLHQSYAKIIAFVRLLELYYFFAKLYDSKNERKACYFNFFHECLTKFTADRSKTRKDSFLKVNTPEPIVLNNLGNINMLLKNQ